MPLFVCGAQLTKPPESITELTTQYPDLRDSVPAFLAKPIKSVGPENLLYVIQREYAVVTPNDKSIAVMGSEDATTCHVVVIRHTGSGVCALSHCDGCQTQAGIDSMVNDVTTLSTTSQQGRLEVYIAGGFLDKKNTSADLTREVLACLIKQPADVHLILACCTELNDIVNETDQIHYPAVMGVAVNVRTGEVFPATFPDHGPDDDIRSAGHFGTPDHPAGFHNVYSHTKEQLVVGPYHWESWDGIESWLRAPDHLILKYMSTSPEQEPPYFPAHMKATLSAISRHPSPSTTLFSGDKPRCYTKLQSGEWTPVA